MAGSFTSELTVFDNTMRDLMDEGRTAELPYKLKKLSETELEVSLFALPETYAGENLYGYGKPCYEIPIPFTATGGDITVSIKSANGSISHTTHTIAQDVDKEISVSDVTLDKDSAEISIRESLQLNAEVLPANASNKKVLWKSTNDKVAKVTQNGLVTGIGEGTADIVAQTEDGGFTAKCGIKVNGTVLPLEPGDVDGIDGVTANDASLVMQYVLTKSTEGFADGGLEAAKVTEGKEITAADAAAILLKSRDNDF